MKGQSLNHFSPDPNSNQIHVGASRRRITDSNSLRYRSFVREYQTDTKTTAIPRHQCLRGIGRFYTGTGRNHIRNGKGFTASVPVVKCKTGIFLCKGNSTKIDDSFPEYNLWRDLSFQSQAEDSKNTNNKSSFNHNVKKRGRETLSRSAPIVGFRGSNYSSIVAFTGTLMPSWTITPQP